MIRALAITVVFAVLTSLSAASSPSENPAAGFTNTLVPQPSQLSTQEGRLVITPSFNAVTDHFKDARL